jgi:type II secretion system protein N
LKRILFAVAIAIALIWGTWIAIPVSAIQSIIEDSLNDYGLTVTFTNVRKGPFYRLRADGIALKHEAREIMSLNSLEATLRPLHLIVSRIDVSIQGRVGAGFFSGSADLSRTSLMMHLDFERASLADMQFLNLVGIRGTGAISGKIAVDNQVSRITFLLRDADMQPASIAGSFLPLNLFRTVRGSIEADGRRIHVESLSLEGPNVFARLKGVIMKGRMDMQMEVMPEKAFLENPLFLAQIERYQVSPGYYVIPVKGPVVF